MNNAWHVASEEMYKNTQGNPGGQNFNGGSNFNGGQNYNSDNQSGNDQEVTDVDFEEVK